MAVRVGRQPCRDGALESRWSGCGPKRSSHVLLCRADYLGNESTFLRGITITIIRELIRKAAFQGGVCQSHIVVLAKVVSEKHSPFMRLVRGRAEVHPYSGRRAIQKEGPNIVIIPITTRLKASADESGACIRNVTESRNNDIHVNYRLCGQSGYCSAADVLDCHDASTEDLSQNDFGRQKVICPFRVGGNNFNQGRHEGIRDRWRQTNI